MIGFAEEGAFGGEYVIGCFELCEQDIDPPDVGEHDQEDEGQESGGREPSHEVGGTGFQFEGFDKPVVIVELDGDDEQEACYQAGDEQVPLFVEQEGAPYVENDHEQECDDDFDRDGGS